MYPVDLLKVRTTSVGLQWTRRRVLTRKADTDANYQSCGGRALHRAIERGVNNLQTRRSQNIMERDIKCDRRSWYAEKCSKICCSG